MDKIIDICKEKGIPMLASFHIVEREADRDGLFCTTSLSKDSSLLTKATRVLIPNYRKGKGSSVVERRADNS